MKFSGTIIITDPCYISTDDDWGTRFDYDDECIVGIDEITDYLFENTGIGDGNWDVYKLNYPAKVNKFKSLLENIYEFDDIEDKLIGDFVGSYAADAGSSGVFLLDEILKYNPDFEEDMKKLEKNKCLVTIKDFEGEVIPFFDNSDQLHFIGIGNNMSFYTV